MAHVYARPHHMLHTEEEVLDIVEDDPSTSTREIARQGWLSHVLGISNTDLMHIMLLLTSDPYISSLRKTTTKRPVELDENEIKEYLIEEEPLDSSYHFDFATAIPLGDEGSDLSSDSDN
ncbi:hypothetical protein NQ317_002880 [Molorchus minor]|uniref:Uncharacterized protein n=1 Tax=Molorchus minor TaxID=1323400 RepID=A0ABQ9JRW9_9CUCU|nr:hypothetical protein NQ317_002880 [Molorchus minor]